MISQEPTINRLRALSVLLDSKFKGPFGVKFGLDAILGLIPFIGDFITTSFSVYIIFEAYKLNCSSIVLGRMGLNVLLENLMDLIPGVGTIFDFAWKANLKNVALLENHMQNPNKIKTSSTLVLVAVALMLIAPLVLAFYFTILLFFKIF